MGNTNPWSAFFWNDYEGDRNLRQCSLAAQGLWMRMLCIAAKADPSGYIQVGDIPCPIDRLADMLATDTGKPADEIRGLIAELDSWHVFGMDRQHRIYNRRMIREQKKRKASAKGGKKGGRVTYEKQTGIHATRDHTPDVTRSHGRVTTSTSISNTNTKEDSVSYETSPKRQNLEREAFQLWNDMASEAGLPVAEKFTPARKAGLTARLADCGGIERWAEIIGQIPASPWLRGENASGWRANLDFVLNPKKFVRLMEGTYANQARAGPVDYSDLASETLRRMQDQCSPQPTLNLDSPQPPSKSTSS